VTTGGTIRARQCVWSTIFRLSRVSSVAENHKMVSMPQDGRAGITADLVRRLVRSQFPRWGHLPVAPVEAEGWDNRTYRLGEHMTVRLPTAAGYVPAVAKESRWLPRLARALPVDVPPILGVGAPGEGYPFPWSIRGWLPGETAERARIEDLPRFAVSVAEFLVALQGCETDGGPAAGEHSWYRGASPAHYDEETRRCLASLAGRLDTERAAAVWEAALAAEWTDEPVWFHGDVAAGNLLVEGGNLTAVIDFGTCGVGDPACDLVIAWTLFSGESRRVFRNVVEQEEHTWARARGWVLWKALLGLASSIDSNSQRAEAEHHLIDDVLADHDLCGQLPAQGRWRT
jgi:aminoglycoside phosphotransferase (APT) family kinase protein